MKRLLRIAIYFGGFVTALAYVAACLSPWLSPERFKLSGIPGLAFPVLLILLLFFSILSLYVNRNFSLLLLLLVFAGWKNLATVFAFNRPLEFLITRNPGDVRILGWNVRGLETREISRDPVTSLRHQMLTYLHKQDADILCLQEFNELVGPSFPSNIGYLKDSLHYSYYHFQPHVKVMWSLGTMRSGVAIFSRFPLQNVQAIPYQGKSGPENILTADIAVNGISRRVVVTHLQSMHLGEPKNLPAIQRQHSEDSILNYEADKLSKLRHYQSYHAIQAEQLKKVINASTIPIVLSADLNEVPSSYIYHHIVKGLDDAFLEKGNGLGRTYFDISPTLRIDYLLVTQGTLISQYKKDNIYMSDHFPQVIDIRW